MANILEQTACIGISTLFYVVWATHYTYLSNFFQQFVSSYTWKNIYVFKSKSISYFFLCMASI